MWLNFKLCYFANICILFITSEAFPSSKSNTGVFWQITDIHYDVNYSTVGIPDKMCHRSHSTEENRSIGFFGNYMCDSPWTLVTAALNGMKTINSKPDFILWTGDSVPHVSDNETNMQKVYMTIRNVSDLVHSAFPNVPVFPVLGNHDPYPANDMPMVSDYYEKIITTSGWNHFLSKSEQEQFKKGGYYISSIGTHIRLIGLNTNLWYAANNLVPGHKDPANQFAWLIKQLEDARNKGLKVYIISHVAPGAFERTTTRRVWFYLQYNRPYLDILRQYSDIITAQFYGHGHTDSFRILYNQTGYPVSTLFLSPAVTPWKSTLPGTGSNNPGLRLYSYNKNTGQVTDYIQYFLNLTKANLEQKAVWEIEYRAIEAYNMPDLSAQSLNKLVKTFNQTSQTFLLYYKYNSVSQNVKQTCDTDCYYTQYCSITKLDFDDFRQCFFWRGKTFSPTTHSMTQTTTHSKHQHTTRHHIPDKPTPDYMFYIIGSLALLVFILAVIVSCMCIGRHNRNVGFKYGKFVNPIN